ncbi:hypothetical protein DAPPUDRAFT_117723 [Daphnia pulex]|uniref:Uncharacterized protein n=1 Tax=Daphnia pulex TaxID=6669 RepID=E9HTL1_DAPPU|nr:hypothetical protein DAPPUDRAFT_117723 [Daphnia pulex]|eukprot:EFX64919.1 hypothetical protein DAPPUDRAFT_117723 [Daphnia pulex]
MADSDADDATADNAARFDLIEQGQAALQTKFDMISNQLQLLLNAPRGNIVPPNPPPPPPPPPPGPGPPAPIAAVPVSRRRLDTSSLEKLHGDISLVDFKTWRNRWDDFGRLNQLSTYPVEEQTAALRLLLDTTMQQTVEVALNFTPNDTTLPSEILDAIANHIRLERNVTNRRRKTPTITLDLRAGSARAFTAVTSAIPEPGAEVSVAGLDVLNSLSLAEADLSGAKYDLVQADRSSTLLSVGQLELTVRYGPREAQCTVDLYPKNQRKNLSAAPVRPSWLTSTSFSTSPRAYAALTDRP